MRILVTGASGLLGLNLALEAAQGHTVFGVVNRHGLHSAPGHPEPGFIVLEADLLAPGAIENILDRTQPDWVIHCAAMAIVDACEADPALAHQTNSEVPARLAANVARGGARLVHVSTDAVFDGQLGDYTESDEPHPLSVYARSKLEGEHRVAEADPQAIIARVNLFGWSLSGQRSLSEFFFYNLQAGKQVMGFTDVYFCPLLANDLAPIFIQMLETRLSGLYHVVSSECTNKYEFGMHLAHRFGLDEGLIRPVSVNDAGLKAVRSPNLTLRTDKLAHALGKPVGEATPRLSPGLERLFNLYQQSYPQLLRSLGTV